MSVPSPDDPSPSVTCLGVGEGLPSAEHRSSAFVYQVDRTSLLIDCGDGTTQAYLAAGFDQDTLDGVVLSHMHSDHVGGFSLFVQNLWLRKRRRPLPVWAPTGAIPALQQWLAATLLPPELLGFPLEWRPLCAGEPCAAGALTVTPHPTTHLESLRRSLSDANPATSFDAFSFVVEGGGLRIGHSADIGAVGDLEPLLSQPLDLLMCELSHVEPEELAGRLRRAPIRRLALIHLARKWRADSTRTAAQWAAWMGSTVPVEFPLERGRLVLSP